MRVSIVIPTYNRAPVLRRALATALAQDHPDYEMIVVDDASPDDTAAVVQREFPTARYLRQRVNAGPAAARNRGWREAAGEIIAFTDDDCLVPPDWLTRLEDGFRRHPEVVGVGGYLEAPAEALAHNALARYERYMARSFYHVGEAEYLGAWECPAGGTNNLAYRRAALEEVGGFDEGFRYAAGEDADLKWRLCERGHTLLYLPVRAEHLQQYAWPRFKRQSLTRGRGRTQFETRRGQRPTRGALILRLLAALFGLPRDLLVMPEPAYALAHWVELTWGAIGQWRELRAIADAQRNSGSTTKTPRHKEM